MSLTFLQTVRAQVGLLKTLLPESHSALLTSRTVGESSCAGFLVHGYDVFVAKSKSSAMGRIKVEVGPISQSLTELTSVLDTFSYQLTPCSIQMFMAEYLSHCNIFSYSDVLVALY